MTDSSSVILVGNGTAVTERKMADEIESFDKIVRFNNFVTKGYEEYVGTRTEIWSTRVCSTIKTRNHKHFEEILGVMNWCRWTQGIIQLAPRFVKPYPNINLIYPEQVRGYAAEFGYDPIHNWLSVGMITIFYLLEFYPKVHLYGFGGDKSKHYFPIQPSGEQHHDFVKEGEKIAQLEKSGKVVII